MTKTPIQRNPWPGLASYDENNGLFCGRNHAINDLFSLICNNPVVTLYGRSGIGKTSLIKAGVAPVLKQRGFIPVYIRLMRETAGNRSISFANCITEILSTDKRFAVTRCGTNGSGEPCDNPAFLWDWFLTHQFRDTQDNDVTPVIFLDQFEETFSGDNEAVGLLLRQINLLLDDSRRLPDDCAPDTFRSRFRFIFSFRDDALYKMEETLDKYNLGSLKQNRYVLKALNREQAKDVITYPAEDLQSGKSFIDAGVPDLILDKLEKRGGEEIDPAILSLLMAELYERMVQSGNGSINTDFISNLGDSIIKDFYLDGVSQIRKKSAAFLEKELITADGRRKTVSSMDMASVVRPAELEILLQRHILSPFIKGKVTDYELSHDVLCPIVMQNRKKRQEKERALGVFRAAAGVIIAAGLVFLGFYIYWANESKTGKLLSENRRLTGELSYTAAHIANLEESINQAQLADSAVTAFYADGDIKKAYDLFCLSAKDGLFLSQGQKKLVQRLKSINDGFCLSTGRYPTYWISNDGRYIFYRYHLLVLNAKFLRSGSYYYKIGYDPKNSSWTRISNNSDVDVLNHIATDGKTPLEDGYWSIINGNRSYLLGEHLVTLRFVDVGPKGEMWRLFVTKEKQNVSYSSQELLGFLDGSAFKYLIRGDSNENRLKDCQNTKTSDSK